jgi:nucleotide-binding universal stress UspA family protein
MMSCGRLRPVVVGVDGSPASLASIRLAVGEATREERPLRLVHVDSWTSHPAWVDTDPAGTVAHDLGLDPERFLKAVVTGACADATTPVTAEVVAGEPGTVLLRESRTAELLVVSHRGAGGFLGLRLGSVATKVAAHARCPVLVARGTPQPGGCVLLGVSGGRSGPPSSRAIGLAFAEAARRSVALLALHAGTGRGDDPLGYDAEELAREADILTGALHGWAERYPEVRVRRMVVPGRAAGALVDASERAQLVVVGAGRRGALPGLPFGTVRHALLHHSACPVVVAR